MNIEKVKEKVLVALKIREEMQKIFKKHEVKTSYCIDDVNPYFNQIDENSEGIVIEYYYSSPSVIYTPLGCIRIWDSYMCVDENCHTAIREIEETFGLILKDKARNTRIGTIGGWYYITNLPWTNNKLLRDCRERAIEDYIPYKESKDLYNQIINNRLEK